MKYLMSNDGNVTMKGEYVKAGKESRIYDTEAEESLSVPMMKKIATKNKFKVTGKKSEEVRDSFEDQLSKLKLKEQNKMSDTDNVLKIVKENYKDDSSQDEILIKIVQSGVPFKAAIRKMKEALVELGFVVNNAELYKKVSEYLDEEEFEPDTYEEVLKMCVEIEKEVKGVSSDRALVSMKKYFREEKIDMPKKPKKKKFNLATKVIAWMVSDEHNTDIEKFKEFLEAEEVSEKLIASFTDRFIKVQEFTKTQETKKA